MKDFNSYVNSGSENFGESGVDINAVLNMIAGKYEGAKEDEIIAAIINEAERGRKNGTLTDADIINFEKSVSPMLTEAQRKKLKKVVAFLMKK